MSNLKPKIDQQLLYLDYNWNLFDTRYAIILKGMEARLQLKLLRIEFYCFHLQKYYLNFILPQ